MARTITERELRDESDAIMRALDSGESFVVTQDGVPVGRLTPVRRPRFVAAHMAIGAFEGAALVDPQRFRSDLDRFVNQEPAPRVS